MEAVLSWEPKNMFKIYSFWVLQYNRRFIEDFSKLAIPMTDLTKKSTKFEWAEEYENAFSNNINFRTCFNYSKPDKPYVMYLDVPLLSI